MMTMTTTLEEMELEKVCQEIEDIEAHIKKAQESIDSVNRHLVRAQVHTEKLWDRLGLQRGELAVYNGEPLRDRVVEMRHNLNCTRSSSLGVASCINQIRDLELWEIQKVFYHMVNKYDDIEN